MAEEKDVIDRKVDGVVKLFELVRRNVLAFVATISIVGNVFLVYKIITTNEELNKQIVEEVRKQVAPAVEQKVDDKLDGVVTGVDNLKNRLNNVIDTVERRLNK
jgi:hypothetical protein